jgi:hypothetical protein
METYQFKHTKMTIVPTPIETMDDFIPYFTYSYLRSFRVILAFLWTKKIFVMNPERMDDIELHELYVLQMDLLVQLFRYTNQWYNMGLRLLFQETPDPPGSTREKFSVINPPLPFFFPTISKPPDFFLLFPHQGQREPDSTGVSDWTFRFENTEFIKNNKVRKPKPLLGFRGMDASSLFISNPIPIRSDHLLPNSYPIKPGGRSKIPFLPTTTGLKSWLKKRAKKKKSFPDSVTCFFYENYQATLKNYPVEKVSPIQSSWKLNFHGLDQMIGWGPALPSFSGGMKKRDSVYNLRCFSEPSRPGSLVPNLNESKSSDKVRGVTLKNENIVFESTKTFFQSFEKSPVIMYKYEALTRNHWNQPKGRKSSVSSIGFQCLLEAATRTWICTLQENPFGKVTLLVQRKFL